MQISGRAEGWFTGFLTFDGNFGVLIEALPGGGVGGRGSGRGDHYYCSKEMQRIRLKDILGAFTVLSGRYLIILLLITQIHQ